MTSLKPGQALRGANSQVQCHVESFIGAGGQGEVYRVTLGAETFALKWYNDTMLRADPFLRSRLEASIRLGAPSERFLWPFELVTLPDGGRFGYLMRLRDPGYASVHKLLVSSDDWPSFRVLAGVCFNLADAFLQLHAKGLSYQDISAGNVFFDPRTGAVQICDNDNVDVDGRPSVMGGTREYQAPELVERRAGPSRATDLHALAVLLFRLLAVNHPLVGAREHGMRNSATPEATRQLFGSEARFVFDPEDASNAPVPGRDAAMIALWPALPRLVRDLFTRAFTAGLRDPAHGRVQEGEWRRAMVQLRDSVMNCPHCGYENFYDPRRVAAREPVFGCWNPECAKDIPSGPPRMGIWARQEGARPSEPPHSVVVLTPGARLYAHHLHTRDYEFDTELAEVVAEPLGLKNLSRDVWHAGPEGERRVAPGDAVPLAPELRIRFGGTEARVKM